MSNEIAELNEKQKQKIQNYLRDNRKLKDAIAKSITKKRKSSTARQIQNNHAKYLKGQLHSIYNLFPVDMKDKFQKTICQELNYCTRQKGYKAIVNFVTAIAAYFWNYFREGIIAILTGAVLFGFLDDICKCKIKNS